MRENFDCALLLSSECQSWAAGWEGSHAKGRLQVKRLDNGGGSHLEDETWLLSKYAPVLKAYDACLLPVSSANLAWARISLSRAPASLETPIVVLGLDLQAVALCDLIRMGVSDFICAPSCPDELRARLEKIRFSRKRKNAARRQATYDPPEPRAAVSRVGEPVAANGQSQSCMMDLIGQADDLVLQSCLQRKGIDLSAFAAAAANRCALTQLPFKEAKNQVVSGFEQAYLSAMLGRCSGNIAQAARCADKHRRAFWALVRKHDIDAAQFREHEPPFPG